MAHGISKENQSSDQTAYRFGEFELHPCERLLKRGSGPIPLQPKAFDALLCLVRKAEHLVSKQELTETLWPSTYVSESNLTNIMVGLRKILGRDAIRTVSKHGYRFVLPVAGEPGVSRATYEKFARAKELTAQRTVDSISLARELYWTCLAEDPSFASAWAWLGRCSWFLAKFSESGASNAELAEAAFRRAFALDPDLACAHQFYTFMEVDMGNAPNAMVRLLSRLQSHPDEPESYTGLVQVLRFCGLLDESLTAGKRAVDLDPAVVTSVSHTLFLRGEYASAIETYSGRGAYYLDAAAWAALGNPERACRLLCERLRRMSLSRLMTGLMSSLLAVLEGRANEAVRQMEQTQITREPEILVYFARHYAYLGLVDPAVNTLTRAAQSGFICAPETLTFDPWLGALRKHSGFPCLLRDAETRVKKTRSSLRCILTNYPLR